MSPKELLETLLKLQSFEFDEREYDDAAAKIIERKMAELRLQVPLQILNHYDRLVARGKKGVAAVRHQTCTGCHMRVTKAAVINLMRGDDIQVCDNCGRYLFLPKDSAPSQDPGEKSPSLEPLPDAA